MNWKRTMATGAAFALLVSGMTLAGSVPASAAITQLDADWITPPTGTETAGSPALTRTADGDILLAYPTGHEDTNASVRVRRSTDDGATWSPYTEVFTGSPGVNGNTAVGMTTLSDGTILLPFSTGVVTDKYTHRTTETYIARSTDNGVTWDPATVSTPVVLPAPWNGPEVFNAAYGRIVDLGSGELLLPVFGSPTQTPQIGADFSALSHPVPWAAGVFRSTDNGLTWTSYSEIAIDRNNEALYHNNNGFLPTAVTEPTITVRADGSLLALLRYDTTLSTQMYFRSVSNDGGNTWSPAVKTTLNGRGGTIDIAPCSSDLPAGRSKLVAAYLDFTSSRLVFRSSYDDGASWGAPTAIDRPAGSPTAGYDFYPDMVELPGNRMLVVYTAAVAGIGNKVASAVIQDSDSTTCNAELTASDAASTTALDLFLLSGDHDRMSWNYSSRAVTASPTSLVSQLTTSGAPQVTCGVGSVGAYKDGVLLPPGQTLAAAGVADGDTIEFRSPSWTGFTTAGFADADLGYLRSGGYVHDPTIRHQIMGFVDDCDYRVGMDFRGRSLGATFTVTPGQMVTALHVRDSDGASTLPTSAFTVWKSVDNKTWSQVSFTLTKTVEASGRQVLHFGGLNTAGPYLKVHVNTTSSVPQVIIESARNDVWVSCNVAGGGCPAT